MQKKALILGVSGQDGAYLAKLLLDKGYEVYGSSRDAQTSSFANLTRLGIKNQINFETVMLNDFGSVLQSLIKVRPDEIYNLAGQTSVGLSFEQPVETIESISTGTLNLLEAMRSIDSDIKLFNAGSSECFGEVADLPADESTAFRPRSPYATAKAAAHWEVVNYREAYNVFACSGILFNHESVIRSNRFVTQKIVAGACCIAAGLKEQLHLGNLSVQRDWGWAPEYVQAMWLMLQNDVADDFVIATGHTYSLEQFAERAFSAVNLDWREYVVADATMLRPTDIMIAKANPTKALEHLGWQAQSTMPEVVRLMVESFQISLQTKLE
jgi:GDPmannose 4,6-dehydratase